MQEWTKAKEIYQSKLNKSIDNQHTEGMAHYCHQLGYIHYQLNDLDTALEYLQKSLNILRERRKINIPAAADTYSMIGQVLFEQKKDFQAALDNMQQALTMRVKEYEPEPQVKNERNV
jgi:tetratricopeptide (TPR) repeat protein